MAAPPTPPLPEGALWGAQTELARAHFAIGDALAPRAWVEAVIAIKVAAARAHVRLGRQEAAVAQAIERAAAQALAAAPAHAFPLAPWVSGSGTQIHMNVNEVLARLGSAHLGPGRRLHPNDDVNLGQSSNDVMPAALHVAALQALQQSLQPALQSLLQTLTQLGQRFGAIVKLGRTHLQDAVPLTFGQELQGWQGQLEAAQAALQATVPALSALPLGGTAVGTGLNSHPAFAAAVCEELAAATGLPWVPASNRFAALSGHQAAVALHGALKLLAVALHKLASDLRLLASGPHGGLGELKLPANEPGSSIMPGKVNPTQCEMLVMVCLQVFGHDLAVTLGAAGGQLQLNTCQPLLAVNLLGSLRLLADAMRSFDAHALRGLQPDTARITAALQASLMSATALAPHLGYDRAARIVAQAQEAGLPLRQAALAAGVDAADFDRWTDSARMLGPA